MLKPPPCPANPYRLDGQVALITAGASGLGAGTALVLAGLGANVAIADLDETRAQALVRDIEALGSQALAITTDMRQPEQVASMVRSAADHFGRIDILLNNAGGTRQVPFIDQDERNWRRLIDLNLMSMLAATHAVAGVMIEGGRGGTIVNVASSEALRAAPGYAVYAACKAGMVSFGQSMALELADHGIRVHTVAPDMIDTPGMRPFYERASPEEAAARSRYLPMRRIGTMAEFGNVVAFLASPMASYLNGVTIPVDGGTTASHGWTRAPDRDEWVLFHPGPAPG